MDSLLRDHRTRERRTGLTLHGQSRPLRFPIQGRVAADRLEAAATATLKQSDFGIKPYATALGTVSVRDEVTIEITLIAVRVPRDFSPALSAHR